MNNNRGAFVNTAAQSVRYPHCRRALSGMLIFLVPMTVLHAQRLELGAARPLAIQSTEHPLGAIQAVLAFDKDRLLVLGGASRQLLLIGRDGRLLGSPTNLAASPIRLSGPVAMSLDGRDRLLIIDQRTPSVTYFRLGNRSVTYLSTRQTALFAMLSVCRARHGIFASGLREPIESSELIHEIGLDGAIVRSLARPPEHPTGFASALYFVRYLQCAMDGNILVSAARSFADVQAHSEGGTIRWSVNLPDYRSLYRSSLTDASPLPRLPDDGLWDKTMGVFAVAPDVVAVQVARFRGVGSKDIISLRTFLLSALSGKLLREYNTVPLIVGMTLTTLYATDNLTRRRLLAIPFKYTVH